MEKTHLTRKEIMWEVSWTMIEMMLVDMPKSVKRNQVIIKASGRDAVARKRNG